MKNISTLILAATLAIAPMAAQPQNSAKIDTIVSVTEDAIVVDPIDISSATEEPVEVDDNSESVDDFISGFSDGSQMEKEIVEKHMGHVVGIIAIIFGVPCLAIIAALIVILIYALKRNQRRNAIIAKAIDNNYQLPDSFYTGQKSGTDPNGPVRDSRKFYSSVTFIAVGFSLIVFAIASDEPFFLLCGGIPLLIGIGKLIGYFCVPSGIGPMNPRPPYNPPYPPRNQGWNPNGQMPNYPHGSMPSYSDATMPNYPGEPQPNAPFSAPSADDEQPTPPPYCPKN